jgi:hypothetical protein
LGVALAEHVGLNRVLDRLSDLGATRPEVTEKDVVSFAVLAKRIACQINVHRARQRIGDD